MKPGTYNITDLADDDDRYFLVSGDNNTIDLTGVTIHFPVEIRTPEAHFYFSGRGNTLIGGTIENTYVNGATQITDFVSYNADRRFFGNGGKPQMVIAGNDTSMMAFICKWMHLVMVFILAQVKALLLIIQLFEIQR